jgi:hypothetical protein
MHDMKEVNSPKIKLGHRIRACPIRFSKPPFSDRTPEHSAFMVSAQSPGQDRALGLMIPAQSWGLWHRATHNGLGSLSRHRSDAIRKKRWGEANSALPAPGRLSVEVQGPGPGSTHPVVCLAAPVAGLL